MSANPADMGYGVGPVIEVAPGHYKRSIEPQAEWTKRAALHPVKVVARETEPGHWLTDVVPAEPIPPLIQLHLVCGECEGEPSVFCLSPDTAKQPYLVSVSELLAGVLGHLRRSHDPGVASP